MPVIYLSRKVGGDARKDLGNIVIYFTWALPVALAPSQLAKKARRNHDILYRWNPREHPYQAKAVARGAGGKRKPQKLCDRKPGGGRDRRRSTSGTRSDGQRSAAGAEHWATRRKSGVFLSYPINSRGFPVFFSRSSHDHMWTSVPCPKKRLPI